jgi:pilus assembly protein Flp/PilA
VKNRFSLEKGQGLVEYLLIIVLVVVVIVGAVHIMSPAVGRIFSTIREEKEGVSTFDQSFASGESGLSGNLLELGKFGSPQGVDPRYQDIVPVGEEIGSSPRQFNVSGCQTLVVDSQYNSLYAATSFPSPEMVTIQMQPTLGGPAIICVPTGSTINLFLWAK